MENEQTKREYLDELVQELLQDKEWELPEEHRMFIKGGVANGLLFL